MHTGAAWPPPAGYYHALTNPLQGTIPHHDTGQLPNILALDHEGVCGVALKVVLQREGGVTTAGLVTLEVTANRVT